MPQCKKCNGSFSKSITIDGKLKVSPNRLHCFNCSPFNDVKIKAKELLTEKIVLIDAKEEKLQLEKLTCSICSRVYTYHHKDPKGHTRLKCNSCIVNIRRFDVKKKCVEYKGGKCEMCGYDKCLRALTFHHKDPKEKDFSIASKHCLKFETLKLELDKCVLLCSNCHAEEHDKLEGFSNKLKE